MEEYLLIFVFLAYCYLTYQQTKNLKTTLKSVFVMLLLIAVARKDQQAKSGICAKLGENNSIWPESRTLFDDIDGNTRKAMVPGGRPLEMFFTAQKPGHFLGDTIGLPEKIKKIQETHKQARLISSQIKKSISIKLYSIVSKIPQLVILTDNQKEKLSNKINDAITNWVDVLTRALVALSKKIGNPTDMAALNALQGLCYADLLDNLVLVEARMNGVGKHAILAVGCDQQVIKAIFNKSNKANKTAMAKCKFLDSYSSPIRTLSLSSTGKSKILIDCWSEVSVVFSPSEISAIIQAVNNDQGWAAIEFFELGIEKHIASLNLEKSLEKDIISELRSIMVDELERVRNSLNLQAEFERFEGMIQKNISCTTN
jgi:hypothetical protein